MQHCTLLYEKNHKEAGANKKGTGSGKFNPLRPSINMYVLLSVLVTYVMVIVLSICLNIKGNLSLVIQVISFILVTCMFDQVVML